MKITAKLITKTIKELNRLDLENTSYEYVLKKIEPLVRKVPIFIQMSKSTDLYYRTRICNEKHIESIEELYSPPVENIKGYQRCNKPKTSMFYSSSKRITTLLECNVQEGDIVYLSQWINKQQIPLNYILNHNSDVYGKGIIEDDMIINYLDTIFTRPVPKAYSNTYKITAAITELITNNFTPSKEFDIRADKSIALVYPSIVDIKGSYNTVLSDKLARERLDPLHIIKLKIIKRKGHSIEVEIIDNAIETVDGRICWLNDKNKLPKLLPEKGKSVPFLWSGKSYYVPVMENIQITKEIINDLLYE